MEGRPPPRSAVRFGAFEMDLQAGELRKSGIKLRLQEQPFLVLTLLLERPGEIVTREEIQHKLWPEDTFVDFENSLNSAVARLREVLGDSATHPRFVETVPRKGYRFVAPVEASGVPARPPLRRRDWTRVAPFAFVVVAVAAAIWYFASRPDAPEAPFEPVPLTSYPDNELDPSFSPDGTQVVFAWNKENGDNYDIYVKVVGTEEALSLTRGPTPDYSPAWSPDGCQIAFLRRLGNGKTAVLLTSPLGGPEHKLAEVSLHLPRDSEMSHLSWHPSSRYLVVVDSVPEEAASGLFLISIESGEKRRLTSPSGEWDIAPAFSPDGRKLAFVRGLHVASDLYLLALTEDLHPEHEPLRLSSERLRARSPVWTSDGREIIFSVWGQGLWRINANGRERPRRVAYVGEGGVSPAISRQGDRLAYAHLQLDTNVWRVELALPETPAVRLIESTYRDWNAAYSPDGARIAFASARSGNAEIWVCDPDGSNPVQLTSFGSSPAGAPSWSPDGRWIAFVARQEGQADIHIVGAGGGPVKRRTQSPSNDANPAWSRDGRWVYFRSNRSGEDQVWKIPADEGPPIQVTRNGGALAKEDPGGHFLYYAKSHAPATSVWKMPTDGGEEVQVLDSLRWTSNFEVVDRGIYFIPAEPTGDRATLEFYEFGSEETHRITTLPMLLSGGLSVSPGGRFLLYSHQDFLGSDLMLVEGFR